MNKEKLAVIYARYSSHNQTEQSIEGQLHDAYEYANKNGYTVIDEYTDVGKTLLGSVLHQESALVLDGIGFAVQVVFIGKTAV